MKNSNLKHEVLIGNESQHYFEYFVEEISNKLYINEIYFGNLSTGMDALLSLLTKYQEDNIVCLSYNTDYQSVNIFIDGVSRETAEVIDSASGEIDNPQANDLFMLLNVTESVAFENGRLTLVFDIGAMSKQVYEKRRQSLFSYFNGEKTGKLKKSNDHFYL